MNGRDLAGAAGSALFLGAVVVLVFGAAFCWLLALLILR